MSKETTIVLYVLDRYYKAEGRWRSQTSFYDEECARRELEYRRGLCPSVPWRLVRSTKVQTVTEEVVG